MAFESLLLERVKRLSEFPNIGRAGRVEGTREWVLGPNYTLIYNVTDAAVITQAMVHTRRRYP